MGVTAARVEETTDTTPTDTTVGGEVTPTVVEVTLTVVGATLTGEEAIMPTAVEVVAAIGMATVEV